MNLPNKLTILRMFLIIPFVVILLTNCFGNQSITYALIIFIIASLTDMLDGMIARKYNLITNFGKFMDPLADKMLVTAAFICLVEMGKLPAWAVIIILSREFIISGFRLIASDNGVVIAASYFGKFKTVFQMILVIMLLLYIPGLTDRSVFMIIEDIVMYITIILTIVSLLDYLWKNKDVLKDKEN